MMNRTIAFASVLFVGAALAVGTTAMSSAPAGPSMATTSAAATTYMIDGTHSSVVFRVMHMNTAPFYGRFNQIAGSIDWNAENPESSSISFSIPTESVDTANEGRDGHLRSPDFFNAKEFTEITFKSTKITPRHGETYTVQGDLTMLSETKPVTVELVKTGENTHPRSGKPVIGFEAVATIKRSDFGMNYGVEQNVLGDEVKIMFGLEAAAE